MTILPPMLAETEISPKLIGFIIVAAIYGIGALASWLSKQKKEQDEIARREQIRRAIEAQQASAIAGAQHQQQQQRQAPPPTRRITPASTPATRVTTPPLPTRRVTPASTPPTRVTAPAPPPLSRRTPHAARRRAAPPPRIAAPAPPVPPGEPTEGPAGNVLSATEIGSSDQTRRGSVSAAAPAIARWLTPDTLRQQFILTEILQPPVALRQPEN